MLEYSTEVLTELCAVCAGTDNEEFGTSIYFFTQGIGIHFGALAILALLLAAL